ncbi:MAG: phosphate/phosphite/phosphonate ABC transporter substrate-binding protein [Armatimonadota bacterium]
MPGRLLAGIALAGVLIVSGGRGEHLIAAAPTTGGTGATVAIVLGEISHEPAKKIKRFQPIADYLAANLRAFGIVEGRVAIATDFQTMVHMLQAGEMHLYFGSPYPAMIMSDRSGARPILRRWKEGVAEYNAVIFARTDSGLRSLADLKGRTIGLEDVLSTTGYFLPLAHLRKAGLHPVERPRADAPVARDDVGYVLTLGDRNTLLWVLNGKVAAGATDNVTFEKIPAEIRSSLTVLAETPKVARHIVMARPVMAPALLAAIKNLLLRMHEVPEGQTVLKEFEQTARFDEFAGGAAMAQMREMFRFVQGR